MIRSTKIKLFATASKLKQLRAVECRFLGALNAYVKHIWKNGGGLDKPTQDTVPLGHLPFNHRAAALQQALGVVAATKSAQAATGNEASCPVVKSGIKLNQRNVVVTLDKPSAGFDIWFRFSTLRKYRCVSVPGKRTAVLNKWLNKPGAALAKGCELSFELDGLYAILWVEIPDIQLRTQGADIGVDSGINKVLVTSEGQNIGEEFKTISARVRRCKPGSKGRARAHTTRDRYLNQCVNQLPWSRLKTVGYEDLKGLKRGKQPRRGKQFRKLLAPWRYGYVLERIRQKAQENCVLSVAVNPAYTSQTCPTCGHRAKDNRVNEKFCCTSCGYSADADHVGAQNILARTLGSISSPRAASGRTTGRRCERRS